MEIVSLSPIREKPALDAFLARAGLRLPEGLTALLGAREGDALLACCGRKENVLQCAAVAPDYQGEGLLAPLVSRLLTDVRTAGYDQAFLFTKPAAVPQFSALGFALLGQTADAALLSSRRNGVSRWAATVGAPPAAKPQKPIGCAVMNANPFTLGHRYLAETAAANCSRVYLLVPEAEASRFSFADRLRLVQAGTADLPQCVVHGGGPFVISMATFPTYFLKEPSQAAQVHARLDAAVFARQIAPALGITVRFVGSEPLDPMTGFYNQALSEILPPNGVALHRVERLRVNGRPVSAAGVRALLDEGRLTEIKPLVPESTYAFLAGAGKEPSP